MGESSILNAKVLILLSHGYFLNFCHKFAKFISKFLADAKIAFSLYYKGNKIN